MGYFKEQEIPYQFALANAFTICDAYHCSMHTGTDANRSFHLTGINGAVPTSTAFVNNEWDWIDGDPKNVDIGYTWKTYAERLEEAGVNWICYQNMPDEWGDNMLGAFRTFKKPILILVILFQVVVHLIAHTMPQHRNYHIKPMMPVQIMRKTHCIKGSPIPYLAINLKSF